MARKNKPVILVIPDIHGRIFWKKDLEKFPKEKYPKLDIVFLGDYVDPYDFEGITRTQAIENFKEIIEIAKEDNRIHLLIGNHDMHYWYDAPYKSRVDVKNYNKIKDIFLQNFTLFNVAFDKRINKEFFLFTHAGVTQQWLEHLHFVGKNAIIMHKSKLSEEQIKYCKFLSKIKPKAKDLNELKLNFQGQANLWMASYARGGDYPNGSCIWEDLSEWRFKGTEIDGIWQIFGHSRWSKSDPDNAYIDWDRKFACVDTCSSWIIDTKGNILKANNYG